MPHAPIILCTHAVLSIHICSYPHQRRLLCCRKPSSVPCYKSSHSPRTSAIFWLDLRLIFAHTYHFVSDMAVLVEARVTLSLLGGYVVCDEGAYYSL